MFGSLCLQVFIWLFGEGLVSTILQAPALPDMHMTARVKNKALPSCEQIGQEQATNLVTSVFQTLRVTGQAGGPLLGAPALALYGFRATLTICGVGMLIIVTMTWLCYLKRLKDDEEGEGEAQLHKKGPQEYSQLLAKDADDSDSDTAAAAAESATINNNGGATAP